MNALTQHKLLLLGSEQDVENLAKKDSATILAISDSHGRPELLNIILDKFAKQSDILAFCGDGCNDIAKILNSFDSGSRLAADFPPVMAMVHGNGDESLIDVDFTTDPDSGSKKIKAPAAISFYAAKTNILITHGHMFGVYYGTAGLENHAKETDSKIVLYGHSHIADISKNNGLTFINPGSISLPRQGLPPSFAVIKISSEGKNIDCTFYEIKASLSEGIHFVPFSPDRRRW